MTIIEGIYRSMDLDALAGQVIALRRQQTADVLSGRAVTEAARNARWTAERVYRERAGQRVREGA